MANFNTPLCIHQPVTCSAAQKEDDNMYRLMLVDDESDIREGLQEVIHFKEMGFNVVGDAANGMEALQLCEELRPDLIITDIRMPLMDGLTMCSQIKKLLPSVHFIILSGYDDFEYARQAIEFNAIGYLLKPISSTEFIQMLTEARQKLDDEFALRCDIKRLRQHFNESLPLLKELLLNSILLGTSAPARNALDNARRYTLPLLAPQYALALMRTRPDSQPLESSGIDDPELLNFAILNIAEEVLQPAAPVHLFHFGGALAVLFLLPDESENAFQSVLEWMEKVRKTILQFLDVPVSIGLGMPCLRLADLPKCAKQAISALEQSMLSDTEQVLCITDVEPGSRNEISVSERQLRRLSNALKLCDRDRVWEVLDEMMAECKQDKLNSNDFRFCLLEVLMVFAQTAREMAIEVELFAPVSDSLLWRLMQCPTPVQAREELQNLCDLLLESIRQNRARAGLVLSQQAMEYLQGHFSEEDMSIERLCRHLHISPSYFSMIFKKETRKTFHQALNEMRMDKAMLLLTNTENKAVQIAEQVGMPDPSYFSYAFKKHFGMSPSQARGRKGGIA